MVKIIIDVKKDQFPKISDKIPEIEKRGLELTSQGMLRELKKNSPVDHGLLRSWAVTSNTGNEIRIQTPAQYAKYVNDGTGIYGPYKTPIIHPVIGKKFAFQVNGKMIYTNVIRGQKGQKFVEKSIEATKARITDYFRIAIKGVLG